MIDENGLRMDGRSPGDVRDITIETGVIPVADGSCRMTWGTNEAIVAVYGPMEAHPRKIQRQDRAVLDVAYNMAPFSTTDRMRPGFNRRSREISKVTKDALESVVLLELYPRSKIRVTIEIVSAEAGTRCVGLTAAPARPFAGRRGHSGARSVGPRSVEGGGRGRLPRRGVRDVWPRPVATWPLGRGGGTGHPEGLGGRTVRD